MCNVLFINLNILVYLHSDVGKLQGVDVQPDIQLPMEGAGLGHVPGILLYDLDPRIYDLHLHHYSRDIQAGEWEYHIRCGVESVGDLLIDQ